VVSYGIKAGYRINARPARSGGSRTRDVRWPHVCELAVFLAGRAGLPALVVVGADGVRSLNDVRGRLRVIAVDDRAGLEGIGEGPECETVEHDLERGLPALDAAVIARSVVVVAGVLECLRDPGPLLDGLAAWSATCPYVLIATPDRDRTAGPGHNGPPADPARVREWNLDEIAGLLRACRLDRAAIGHTINGRRDIDKGTILAVAGHEAVWRRGPERSVLAIVRTYNERDIIEETIDHLTAEGTDVHVIDNWSTDGTGEVVASRAAADPRVTVERFPEGPSGSYSLPAAMDHTRRVAGRARHDWIIHCDADEKRRSPWPGVTLRDAIAWVDALGYSAIDFTVLDFHFVDGAPAGQDASSWEDALRFFELPGRPGHFLQVKAWKRLDAVDVDLASTGGHDATFPGRRVYPLKFLVKHYPLRSPEQAARKVFEDRKPRLSAGRVLGWHVHYDRYRTPDDLRWRRSALHAWGDHRFDTEFLVERLSGIGIERAG
jgi:hypothetical protein